MTYKTNGKQAADIYAARKKRESELLLIPLNEIEKAQVANAIRSIGGSDELVMQVRRLCVEIDKLKSELVDLKTKINQEKGD